MEPIHLPYIQHVGHIVACSHSLNAVGNQGKELMNLLMRASHGATGEWGFDRRLTKRELHLG